MKEKQNRPTASFSTPLGGASTYSPATWIFAKLGPSAQYDYPFPSITMGGGASPKARVVSCVTRPVAWFHVFWRVLCGLYVQAMERACRTHRKLSMSIVNINIIDLLNEHGHTHCLITKMSMIHGDIRNTLPLSHTLLESQHEGRLRRVRLSKPSRNRTEFV